MIVDRSLSTQSLDPARLLALTAITGVVWLAGLLLLACPIWLVLHKRRFRGPLAAVLLGAVLCFLFFFGAMTNWFGLSAPSGPTGAVALLDIDWQRGLEAAKWMTPLGALVGLIIWRVAYRRVPMA